MIYDIFNQDILEDGDLNAIPMDGDVLNADGYDEELDAIFFDEYSEDEFNRDIHKIVCNETIEDEYRRMFLQLYAEENEAYAKGDKL